MKMKQRFIAAAAGLLLTVATLQAHHSFGAEFDGGKPTVIKGKVTKVEWVNPHSWVYVDVTDPSGKTVNWACETAPPNVLYRQGWRRDSLKEGDEVSVDGFLAKDGSPTMNVTSVKLADGRRMFAGSAGDGRPPAKPETKQ